MQNNDFVTTLTDFLSCQKKAEKHLREERDTEIRFIKAKHRDVLYDFKVTDAALERLVGEFVWLCEQNPPEGRSDECTEELMEASASTYDEMLHLDSKFHEKWGSQYQEYEKELKAAKKKYRKLMTLLRDPGTFQSAIANNPILEGRE